RAHPRLDERGAPSGLLAPRSASRQSRRAGRLLSPLGKAALRGWAYAYSGSRPGFHLMLQPMLGCCSVGTGRPASTASTAARRSSPVTGTLLLGRLESN